MGLIWKYVWFICTMKMEKCSSYSEIKLTLKHWSFFHCHWWLVLFAFSIIINVTFSISTMANKHIATSICRYIYISFPPEKNRRIYLPGIQDSRLQNSLTRGNHQPHPVANFHYKTSMWKHYNTCKFVDYLTVGQKKNEHLFFI